VDLIDLDVQGAEYDVLKMAADVLHKKVKRVHIETHNRSVELGLRELFTRMSWINIYDYPCAMSFPETWESETDFGVIKFQGGLQTWINPKFIKLQELSDVFNRTIAFTEQGYSYDYFHKKVEEVKEAERKLHDSEQKLHDSDQKLHESEQKLHDIFNSRGWRALEQIRRVRNKIAPAGSWRGQIYDLLMRRNSKTK
jgi:hypothetical protein